MTSSTRHRGDRRARKVGNARFEWSDQDFVGWIALRGRRAVRHRWMRGLSYHRDPCAGIVCIHGTEAGELRESQVASHPAPSSGAVKRPAVTTTRLRIKVPLANASSWTGFPESSTRHSMITPNVGVDVLGVDSALSRRCHRSDQECKCTGHGRRHWSPRAIHVQSPHGKARCLRLERPPVCLQVSDCESNNCAAG